MKSDAGHRQPLFQDIWWAAKRDHRDCCRPAALLALTAVSCPVEQVVQGSKMMEGGGVRICRTVGTGQLRNLDPFLMLVSPCFLPPAHRGFLPRVSCPSADSAACSTLGFGTFENHLLAARRIKASVIWFGSLW